MINCIAVYWNDTKTSQQRVSLNHVNEPIDLVYRVERFADCEDLTQF